MEGPAIFVSHGGEAFPSLTIVLQGYGVTSTSSARRSSAKPGITSSTFKTVPDAPVGSFELTLPEGKFSALDRNREPLQVEARDADRIRRAERRRNPQSTKIAVTGCPKTKKQKKLRKKHKAKGKGSTKHK